MIYKIEGKEETADAYTFVLSCPSQRTPHYHPLSRLVVDKATFDGWRVGDNLEIEMCWPKIATADAALGAKSVKP